MKENKIPWVTYKKKTLTYRESGKAEFYKTIFAGMKEKLFSNKKVQKVLCATGDLKLLPDHDQGPNPPAAWKYHEIWMELRAQYCKKGVFVRDVQ